MTIEQYLYGKVDFNLTGNTVAAILYDRGITEGVGVATVAARQRDLALADLYMFVANSSVSSSAEYESDGGWQSHHSAKNVRSRGNYLSLANDLYAKWGEAAPSTVGKITLKPLY